MNALDTTAPTSSKTLDSTAELPALDVAAYEAQAAAACAAGAPLESAPAVAAGQPGPSAAADDCDADVIPPAPDAQILLEVERWIACKTEELRAQQAALRAAQRERLAGAARAEALNRELGANNASLEALHNRARALESELTRERKAAQRGVAERDIAQREAARLGQELTDVRAAEARQSAELATSGALLQQRSEALEALQSTHAALLAERERAADALAELERRLQSSEARERDAQHSLEAQNRVQAELLQRAQDEARSREGAAAEREQLRAQLASCVERLQNREAYRAIAESSIRELDDELSAAALRAADLEARALQLAAELELRERGLQEAIGERDAARREHQAAVAQHAIERSASEQSRSALDSRLAELTTGAAARVRELELEIASRQNELADAGRDIERGRRALAEATSSLERSQEALAEQSRVLEAREAVAGTMAASHAELVALSAALRAQIEELTARLATPSAEHEALEQRVAALTKEAAESDARIVRLEAMNAELRATVKQLHRSLAKRDAALQRATRIASTNAYALGRVQSSIDELGRGFSAAESASADAQASILTRIDGRRNHSFVLRTRTTIGRDPDNDLSLAMNSVSRRHAVLIPAFRSALLQDLSSTNGVLVNKRRVRCARLQHGDVITLGEAQFRYTVAPIPVGAVSSSQAALRLRAHR